MVQIPGYICQRSVFMRDRIYIIIEPCHNSMFLFMVVDAIELKLSQSSTNVCELNYIRHRI